MIGWGIGLTIFGLLIAGIVIGMGDESLSYIFVGTLFGLLGLLGMIIFSIGICDYKEAYYQERIPNLEQLLDDYEANKLEEKLKTLKEKTYDN